MSYLDRTKHKYWKLGEAVEEKMNLSNFSVKAALTSIRSDLDFYDNPTAAAWKRNWKSLMQSYLKESNSKNIAPQNSHTYNTLNNNGVMLNSTFSGNVISRQSSPQQIFDQTKSEDESSQTESSQTESSQNESSQNESAQNESSQNESAQNESSQDQSSQGSLNSVDVDFPSELSKDYHPLVNEDDYRIKHHQAMPETNINLWTYAIGDTSENCIINDELRAFRDVSLKLEPKSLSDLRLLSLNHIYLFSEELEDSITSYLPKTLHQPIMKDISNHPVAPASDRCVLWCTKLSALRLTNWFDVQNTTITYLNAALSTMKEHPQDLIMANILHRAATTLANGKPNSDIEDSFVHNFISNLFENIFQTESILDNTWANGQLGGKRKNEEDNEQSHFKPDYAVFVKQRSLRLDLLCAEAKSPMNKASFPKSDLLKIGQEMKWILNKAIREGVEVPVVGGVLVTGFTMYTYKMELIDNSIYRMVQLGKTSLFKDFQGLVLLPNIVTNLLQLKNIALTTADKIKDRLLEKAKGIPPKHNPPLSWLRENEVSLTKRTRKQ